MSDSNLASLAQVAETSWGVLPASPVFAQKRFTKETMAYSKETVISGEIRADRQIPDVLQVGYTANGGYDFELSAGELNLLLQNTLFCTPLVVNLPAVSVTIVAGPKSITGATGVFSALLPLQRIRISGTGANDDIYTVVTVAGNGASFTVGEPVVAYTGTATFSSIVYRNGVVRNSLAMEVGLGASSFVQFSGMMVNTCKFTLEAKKIAVGSATFLGGAATSSPTSISAAAYTPATTSPILNCSSNVGRLFSNGVAFNTGIKMLTIDVNNSLRPQPAVGSAALFGVGVGQCKVSGSMQLYFKDLTFYNTFISHTPTSLSVVLSDSSDHGFSFTLPRIQIDTGKTDIPAVNTDIMLDVTFLATLDPVSGMTMQVTQV
jgi:hypothetical protein